MADTGRLQKTYDMYIDEETAHCTLTKGMLVHPLTATGYVTTVSASVTVNYPPYGVALAAATGNGDKVPIAWRGVVEVDCDFTDDTKKNSPVYAGGAAKLAAAVWAYNSPNGGISAATTCPAEYLIVGHLLEDVTSTAAEVKVMLAGW
jgi:hypothetical protein